MVAAGLFLDNSDNGEGAKRCQCVGDDVVDKCRQALLGVRDDGKQHVPCMSDSGVGEESAGAALGDGYEVAQQHGERGDYGEDGSPTAREVQPGGTALDAGEAYRHDLE